MPLTVPQIINIAKVSQALSQVDVLKGSLFGKRVAQQTPHVLRLERRAVEWMYNYSGITSEVVAIGYVTITAVGNDGDIIQGFILDPVLGLISLGSYTKQSGDTTVTILAASITSVWNANTYGYGVTSSLGAITITARAGSGAAINGGSNLIVTITPTTFILLINTTDQLLINTTDKLLYG
jgi:hypothetical protein